MCKGQFRGITNSPDNRRPYEIDSRYADWCTWADQRLAIEPKARAGAAKHMLEPSRGLGIKKALDHSRNLVWDDDQVVLYEPAKYKAELSAKLRPQFMEYGTTMTADFFEEVDKQAAELKAVIDRTAPSKSFVMPSYQDAAAQAAVKRKLASLFPGSQIIKIGSRYPKWEKRTGADLTGMGTGYKLYTLTNNFYKAGDMLVKMPNRPYCQMRSWTVRQEGMVALLGEAGEFMRCD